MNVLLNGSDKSEIHRSLDLSSLDVCFGGFTPMALSDGPASTSQVEKAQKLALERKHKLERAAQIEAARASAPIEYVDDSATTWTYVVLDDKFVRIEDCENPAQNLCIPAAIDEKPVVSLGSDSCAYLNDVVSIDIPDSVISIGFCAFRECVDLIRISFPRQLDRYDSDWVRHCGKLEQIDLPGQLEKITSKVFDSPALKHISIGQGTCEVMPGAFLKSQLEEISIDSQNPYLMTDGRGIYGLCEEGKVLLALATPCKRYDVLDGCIALDRKALSSFADLEDVKLPDTLRTIGDFAFTKTGITSFVAPLSLREIGERAFFDCKKLCQVSLNEGLMFIGDNAFTETAICKLEIPSTVRELGNPIAAKTALSYSGNDATFTIDPASTYLLLDESGGLYKMSDEPENALILLRMLEPNVQEYSVREGTVEIADEAFAKHAHIEQIAFPESLKRIGKGAFKDCRALRSAVLPAKIESVAEEAFLDTALEAFYIPATLTRIGSIALITHGAHHGDCEPTLTSIEVEPENPRFTMDGSLLIEHMDNGKDRLIVCTGAEPDVIIPPTVNAIAPYAFNGLRRLRSLSLSDEITMVEIRGLAFDCLLERVHINLSKPVDGHDSFDIDFPDTMRTAQQMYLAFSTPSFVDVKGIFEHYDNSIVNAAGFDAASDEKCLEPYDQVRLILERLADPVYLSSANRGLADKILRSHLNDFCIEIARHDDKELIDNLIEFGYINTDTIADVIEHVGKVQDASVTNHLLDAKRRMQETSGVDFEADFEL